MKMATKGTKTLDIGFIRLLSTIKKKERKKKSLFSRNTQIHHKERKQNLNLNVTKF